MTVSFVAVPGATGRSAPVPPNATCSGRSSGTTTQGSVLPGLSNGMASDDYLPFFSCNAAGDAILEAARSHPRCQIRVLCGHTHGGGEVQVVENLRVVTGAADFIAAGLEGNDSHESVVPR